MKKLFSGFALAVLLASAMVMPASATCHYNCNQNNNGSGAGAAWFSGGVGSQNMAGALGDLTIAETKNWKTELGGAGVDVATGKPTTAYGFSHVATGGSGMSGAMSFGLGSSMAESMVLGELGGNVDAGYLFGAGSETDD